MERKSFMVVQATMKVPCGIGVEVLKLLSAHDNTKAGFPLLLTISAVIKQKQYI